MIIVIVVDGVLGLLGGRKVVPVAGEVSPHGLNGGRT
jgi:hypothetical protein